MTIKALWKNRNMYLYLKFEIQKYSKYWSYRNSFRWKYLKNPKEKIIFFLTFMKNFIYCTYLISDDDNTYIDFFVITFFDFCIPPICQIREYPDHTFIFSGISIVPFLFISFPYHLKINWKGTKSCTWLKIYFSTHYLYELECWLIILNLLQTSMWLVFSDTIKC